MGLNPDVRQTFVNSSAVEIMQLHRFVREVEGNELSEVETFPVLECISKLKLLPCEIDLGERYLTC